MGIGLGHKRHLGLMLMIVSSVIVLDQFTKWLVTSVMRLHESISVVPGLFNITYIRNSGAAFGILAGTHAGFRLLFFGLTSVLALALLGTIYVRLSPADWVGRVSVSAIFGGAVGNLIDRIRAGEVIDFLDLPQPTPLEIAGEPIPLEILFEDGHLLVLNKPAGLVTHPAPGHWSGTLVNALLHYLREKEKGTDLFLPKNKSVPFSGIGGRERP